MMTLAEFLKRKGLVAEDGKVGPIDLEDLRDLVEDWLLGNIFEENKEKV